MRQIETGLLKWQMYFSWICFLAYVRYKTIIIIFNIYFNPKPGGRRFLGSIYQPISLVFCDSTNVGLSFYLDRGSMLPELPGWFHCANVWKCVTLLETTLWDDSNHKISFPPSKHSNCFKLRYRRDYMRLLRTNTIMHHLLFCNNPFLAAWGQYGCLILKHTWKYMYFHVQ